MESHIAFLVRLGNVDNTFPLLSDPPLSSTGIKQAEEARQFFDAIGMGQVRSVTSAAALEFAQVLTAGISHFAPDSPGIIICDAAITEIMKLVEPGEIMEVLKAEDGTYSYHPRYKPAQAEKMN